MKNIFKFLLVVVAVALVVAALPSFTTTAQGGGTIIESSFGSGPNTFNPLFCNDTACARVTGLLFNGLVGVDAAAQNIAKGVPGALASDWSVSEDGATVTFTLRDDITWNDGTPITTKDFLYAWSIIQSEEAEAALGFLTSQIASVEAPDDRTLVVTLQVADCSAVVSAAGVPAVPSHVLEGTAPAELRNAAYNTAPTVSNGQFKFGEYRVGEQTSLLADAAADVPVQADGFIYKVVPDQTVLVEQFLAGELSVIDGAPVNRRADIQAAADRGEVQVYDFPGNSWDYLALNFADPTNPQPGVDANGDLIDQGQHPLFSDLAVRRAIALGIDVESIIQGAVFGQGSRMAANMIPTSWAADPNLEPLPFDQEAAAKLLEDAGWVAGSDGVRAKDGTRLAFTLYTNQGNTRREAIGTIVKDQLAQIGIEVDFQTIDFNVLVDRLRSQTFDAVILGWRNGFPDDPDQTTLFTSSGDLPNRGQNFISWANPEVNDLMARANSLPGCDQTERAALYAEIQAKFQEDLPYIPLFVINGQYAARSNVNGFQPEPNVMFNRIEEWTISQ